MPPMGTLPEWAESYEDDEEIDELCRSNPGRDRDWEVGGEVEGTVS